MLCLYWMSFPVFLARTVFCGDGLGWGEGSALRTPCQAGEWLSCDFSVSKPSAWCLWGGGCPVWPFFFLTVMRFSNCDNSITGLNWEDGPYYSVHKFDYKYIMIISFC